jgi:cytochrome c oxidase subunit 2
MILAAGLQSALEPAGVHAEKIAALWTVFLWVLGIAYVATMTAMLIALFRKRSGIVSEDTPRARIVVAIAGAATGATLFGLLVAVIFTTRGLNGSPRGGIEITVTARQWWWQFDYDDPDKSKRITTANEITVPVGVPIHLNLRSPDVIHSFWVPNLHGKRDLVPGHPVGFSVQADRPGVFRGQCAEFCGVQHAKMAFWVNAVPPDEYGEWVALQRQSSPIPSTPAQRKGQEVFMESPCPLCHSIAGTDASGKTAPDLTHFASRRSIAAATLPNTREHLRTWIRDPQGLKPGNQMPPMILEQARLEPLLDYLESLQ